MARRTKAIPTATDSPNTIKELSSTPFLRQFIDSQNILIEKMKLECVKDESKSFPDRTIKDWGSLSYWYADVMLDFNTYKVIESDGEVGMCYKQAQDFTYEYENLTYFEGYAVTENLPIPIFHAWCSDIKEKHVVDPTWYGQKEHLLPSGCIGIAFSNKFLAKYSLLSGTYGVLDTLWMHREVTHSYKMKDMLDMRWYSVDNTRNRAKL